MCCWPKSIALILGRYFHLIRWLFGSSLTILFEFIVKSIPKYHQHSREMDTNLMPTNWNYFPITMNMNDMRIALLLYGIVLCEIGWSVGLFRIKMYIMEPQRRININTHFIGREGNINLENKSIFIANISTARFKLTIFNAPTKKQYKTCLSHSKANFEFRDKINHNTENRQSNSTSATIFYALFVCVYEWFYSRIVFNAIISALDHSCSCLS